MDSLISFAGGKLDQCESFVGGVLLSQAHDASRFHLGSHVPMWHYDEYAVRLLNWLQDTDELHVDTANLRPKLHATIPVNSVRILTLFARAVHRI